MERTLSLVLDEYCKVSLTLMKDEAENIDEFTTRFENSEELRNNFKDKIESFLHENKIFIDYVKEQTGKNYRGSIVLLQAIQKNETELDVERQLVLYKKHLIVYPFLIKQDIMKEYLNEDKKRATKLNTPTFTTNYMHYRIKDHNFDTKKNIDEIKYFIKISNFYEKLRLIFKAYEKIRIYKGYKTVDAIYKNLKDEEQNKIKEEEEAWMEYKENKTPDLRDKYKNYSIEDLINSSDDYDYTR